MNASFRAIAPFADHEAGHFFHYQCSCQSAVQHRFNSYSVYAPEVTHASVLPPGWRRWFRSRPKGRLGKRVFWEDCRRLFKEPSPDACVYFLESLEKREFRYITLAALAHARDHDFFFCLYRSDFSNYSFLDRIQIWFCSFLLIRRFGKRFVALTDSELIASYVDSWLGVNPRILPIPHTYYVPRGPFKFRNRIILSHPGQPRKEKGSDLLGRLVQIQDAASNMFELHVSEEHVLPEVCNEITVRRRPFSLSKEQYYDALSRTDVVLLPYDPVSYSRRTSGILVETIVAGKMPLVRRGSWLAFELDRFGLRDLIVDWGCERFFDNVYRLVNSVVVHEGLERMQGHYAKFHSSESFGRVFGGALDEL